MTTSDQTESSLAKPLFATLICAGYVYLAVFFYFMFNALFVLYLTDDARLDSWAIGLAVSMSAFGSVFGATVAGAVVRRVGVGRALIVGTIGSSSPVSTSVG